MELGEAGSRMSKQGRGPDSDLDSPLSKHNAILTTEIISDMDWQMSTLRDVHGESIARIANIDLRT
jgi:hypothetical protein